NRRRIAGEDPGGDARGAGGPLPALAGGSFGALVAQHPQRSPGAVAPEEGAGGGLERVLSEDHLHGWTAVHGAARASRASQAGLQLVEEWVGRVAHGSGGSSITTSPTRPAWRGLLPPLELGHERQHTGPAQLGTRQRAGASFG